MATENYEVADWDMTLKKSSFEKVHKNLVIDKQKSYTSRIKDNSLMYTDNREALVGHFLAKYRVNENGGMKFITQSGPFKLDGTYKEHDKDTMELKLNEDGSYVFLTQNDKDNILPLKMKVWDAITLEEDEDCIKVFESKFRDLKEKKLSKLDLIVDNTLLAVTYYDYDHEDHDHFSSYLEKYQIVSK